MNSTEFTLLIAALPIGAIIAVLLFILARVYSKSDRFREVVVAELKEFIQAQNACYLLLQSHQSGQPCGSSGSLRSSRTVVSESLKALALQRQGIAVKLAETADLRWRVKHSDWREAMVRDGLITAKAQIDPLHVSLMNIEQLTYTAYLEDLRKRVIDGNEKLTFFRRKTKP
ncbi:MAG: hypothetical protein EOP84_00540 [Verrucomicrobiaceae bacterium]|nr:MAG: hypothetical protein EOP84_00540 [Verrucomicrobiaceae bacterium]